MSNSDPKIGFGFGFDTSIVQWLNQREGSFLLRDQDGLATKWECYKKLHKMKAQVRKWSMNGGWTDDG